MQRGRVRTSSRLAEYAGEAREGERVAPRHLCSTRERRFRLFELSGNSQRDTQHPMRPKRLAVVLNGPTGYFDGFVQATGGAQTRREVHGDVRGERIHVEGAA